MEKGSLLLQLLLENNSTEDLNIISSQLSCISALIIFIPQFNDNKLFTSVIKRVIIFLFTILLNIKNPLTMIQYILRYLRWHHLLFRVKRNPLEVKKLKISEDMHVPSL